MTIKYICIFWLLVIHLHTVYVSSATTYTYTYTLNNIQYTWSIVSNSGMLPNQAFSTVYNKTSQQLMLISGNNPALYVASDYNFASLAGGTNAVQLISNGGMTVTTSADANIHLGRGQYIFLQNPSTGIYYLGFGSLTDVACGNNGQYYTPYTTNENFCFLMIYITVLI